MATSLKQLSEFLESMGLNYKIVEDQDVILTGASDGDHSMSILLNAQENGNVFELNANPRDKDGNIIHVPSDHEHKNLLLQRLLEYNYKTKFGTWEYNPNDGEIAFNIEIPLEDALMTEKQFARIISMVMTALSEHVPEIKSIIATGKLIEDNSSDDLMAEFAAFLAAKQESSSSSDGI